MSEQPPAADTSNQPGAAGVRQEEEGTEEEKPGCPICEFIEAGPCGSEHKVWRACRGEANEQQVDYVQHCSDKFRSFFGCMLSHKEYYQPFLEAFHVDVDLSQQAIDNAKSDKQQGQQQRRQQQQSPRGDTAMQQQQQQQEQQQVSSQSVLQQPGQLDQQQQQQPAQQRHTTAQAAMSQAGRNSAVAAGAAPGASSSSHLHVTGQPAGVV